MPYTELSKSERWWGAAWGECNIITAAIPQLLLAARKVCWREVNGVRMQGPGGMSADKVSGILRKLLLISIALIKNVLHGQERIAM